MPSRSNPEGLGGDEKAQEDRARIGSNSRVMTRELDWQAKLVPS